MPAPCVGAGLHGVAAADGAGRCVPGVVRMLGPEDIHIPARIPTPPLVLHSEGPKVLVAIQRLTAQPANRSWFVGAIILRMNLACCATACVLRWLNNSEQCLLKRVEQWDVFALQVTWELENQVDRPVLIPLVSRCCAVVDVTADPDTICQSRNEALLLLSAMFLVQMSDKKIVRERG